MFFRVTRFFPIPVPASQMCAGWRQTTAAIQQYWFCLSRLHRQLLLLLLPHLHLRSHIAQQSHPRTSYPPPTTTPLTPFIVRCRRSSARDSRRGLSFKMWTYFIQHLLAVAYIPSAAAIILPLELLMRLGTRRRLVDGWLVAVWAGSIYIQPRWRRRAAVADRCVARCVATVATSCVARTSRGGVVSWKIFGQNEWHRSDRWRDTAPPGDVENTAITVDSERWRNTK